MYCNLFITVLKLFDKKNYTKQLFLVCLVNIKIFFEQLEEAFITGLIPLFSRLVKAYILLVNCWPYRPMIVF